MSLKKDCGCACSSAPKLIFSCSGAADVGKLSDEAARIATLNGKGKMFCLAGIGGKVSGIIESTKAAAKIVAVDGCQLDCAKKTLNEAGFNKFEHIRLTDEGFIKGQSPVEDDAISIVSNKIEKLLEC